MYANTTKATQLGNYILALFYKFDEINNKYTELLGQPDAINNAYNELVNKKKNIYTFVRERRDKKINPRYKIEKPSLDNLLKLKYINTDKNNDEVRENENNIEEYQFGSFDNIYRNKLSKHIMLFNCF